MGANGIAKATGTALGVGAFASPGVPRQRIVRVPGRASSPALPVWTMTKSPGDTLDYAIDWSECIERMRPGDEAEPETILSSAANVVEGSVAINSQTLVGGLLVLVLEGGTPHDANRIEVTMTTSKGRVFSRVIGLRIWGC